MFHAPKTPRAFVWVDDFGISLVGWQAVTQEDLIGRLGCDGSNIKLAAAKKLPILDRTCGISRNDGQ
jgi:hypothetical protein